MTTYIRSADGLELVNATHVKRVIVVDGELLKPSTVFIRFVDGLPFVVFTSKSVAEAVAFSIVLIESILKLEQSGGGILDVAEASTLFLESRATGK